MKKRVQFISILFFIFALCLLKMTIVYADPCMHMTELP